MQKSFIESHYANVFYAECLLNKSVMLNVTNRYIMLSVIMLYVTVLNVMAPIFQTPLQ
jgi:hypothetical protein